eukprot:SAG31_NODE_1921_length_6916_cov_6.643245_6_plen_49_part_00
MNGHRYNPLEGGGGIDCDFLRRWGKSGILQETEDERDEYTAIHVTVRA